MKSHFLKIFSTVALLINVQLLSAQELKKEASPKKNLFKVNLTALPISNYGLQFERVLSKKISIAFGYRFMPLAGVPLKDNIISLSNGGADMQKTLDQLLLSNSAITPEIRWYPGKKGYGRGFYIAPFARMGNFHGEGVKIEFAKTGGGTDNISLSGDLKSSTFGLLLGAQWSLGKHVCLDWQIIGPHYGSGNGSLTGVSTFTLSAQEQTSIKDALDKVSIPMTTATSVVTSNSVKLNLDGPWAGVRAGISLGIKL
jgi:hypothetical protein